MPRPEIAIGLPVHNGERHLRQALDGLLAQTFGDFQVLILDDGSTDASDSIIQDYLARDSRLHHVRLEARCGLVAAWRRCASLAGERFQPTFFAWHGDHDWVAPDWLLHLYSAIKQSPQIALAHARTRAVDADGNEIREIEDFLDTTGLRVLQRLERTIFSTMGAGDAVYGLFRWSVLLDCGIFHDEILPDRLLITEANLHGEMSYVPTALRFRRQTRLSDDPGQIVERQLSMLFGAFSAKPQPHLSHATFFLRRFQDRPPGADPEAELARAYLGFIHYQRTLSKFPKQIEQELAIEPAPSSLLLAHAVAENRVRLPYAAQHVDAEQRAAELVTVRAAFEQAQSTVAALEKRVRTLTADLEAASAGRLKFKSELVEARTALKEAQKVKVLLEGKLAESQSELANTRHLANAARLEAERWSEQVQAVGMVWGQLEAALADTRQRLQQAKDANVTLKEAFDDRVGRLSAERLQLKSELIEAHASLKEARKLKQHLEGKLTKAWESLRAARREARAGGEQMQAMGLAWARLHHALPDTLTRLQQVQEANVRLQDELGATRASLAAAERSLQLLSEQQLRADSQLASLREAEREREARALRRRFSRVGEGLAVKARDWLRTLRLRRKSPPLLP